MLGLVCRIPSLQTEGPNSPLSCGQPRWNYWAPSCTEQLHTTHSSMRWPRAFTGTCSQPSKQARLALTGPTNYHRSCWASAQRPRKTLPVPPLSWSMVHHKQCPETLWVHQPCKRIQTDTSNVCLTLWDHSCPHPHVAMDPHQILSTA